MALADTLDLGVEVVDVDTVGVKPAASAARANATTPQSERELIEVLRMRVEERKQAAAETPTVETVSMIVSDLLNVVPLEDTAKKIGITPLKKAETSILDVVATFGTWLAHSLGRAEVSYVYDADEAQPALFQVASLTGEVIIPFGYEPHGRHRRDVDRALCTIIHREPDAETITRFVARTYGARTSVLGYPLIAGVWAFATNGRLGSIDLVSDDLVFQSQVLEAFDLLDVARQDAVDAVGRLLGSDQTIDETLRLVQKCFWLDEASLKPLRDATADIDPKTVERYLARLRSKAKHQPHALFPQQVSDLTLGQVQRISSASGIRTEAESRSEETAIRARLKDLGFETDSDRLVPEAMRCARQGALDDFWTIMEARRDGDLSWATNLRELSGS